MVSLYERIITLDYVLCWNNDEFCFLILLVISQTKNIVKDINMVSLRFVTNLENEVKWTWIFRCYYLYLLPAVLLPVITCYLYLYNKLFENELVKENIKRIRFKFKWKTASGSRKSNVWKKWGKPVSKMKERWKQQKKGNVKHKKNKKHEPVELQCEPRCLIFYFWQW